MAVTLQGTVNVGLNFTYLQSATGFDSLTGILNYVNSPTAYTSGSGANQVNAAYISRARSLAGTSENFLLYGTLVDAYGTTLNFTTVKLIYVKNLSTTTAQYLKLSGDFIDGDTSNLGPVGGTTPVIYIGPGGVFLWDSPTDGATVTNSSKETLTVTNAATFTYDIVILGTV